MFTCLQLLPEKSLQKLTPGLKQDYLQEQGFQNQGQNILAQILLYDSVHKRQPDNSHHTRELPTGVKAYGASCVRSSVSCTHSDLGYIVREKTVA